MKQFLLGTMCVAMYHVLLLDDAITGFCFPFTMYLASSRVLLPSSYLSIAEALKQKVKITTHIAKR